MMMAERDNNFNTSDSIVEDDEGDAIAAYRQELANLQLNSKPHILMLTMLAEDYKDSKADEIVDCIEQRLLQVPPDKKLPTLYLIDSICKNLAQSAYIDLFQGKLVRLFCHTFERVDDKTRVLLYKLRQTWGEVFSPEALYNLDLNVKKSDPNWPVNKPTRLVEAAQRNDTNKTKPPASVAPKSASASQSSKSADLGKQLLSKQNELLTLQREQLELDLHNEILSMSNGQSAPRMNESNMNKNTKKYPHDSKRKLSSDQNTSPSSKRKKDTKDKSSTRHLSPSKVCSKTKKEKSKPRKSPISSKSKKSVSEIPVQMPIAPEDVIPLGSSHHTSVSKWSKPEPHRHRNDSVSQTSSMKSRRSPSRRRSRSPPPVSSSRSSRLSPSNTSNHESSTNKKATVQTTIPAPNVFAQPEMLFSYTKMPESHSKANNHAWNPRESASSGAGFGMDRDYRHEFDSFISEAQNKLNTGTITPADHDILVRDAERQLTEIQQNNKSHVGISNPPQFATGAPFAPPAATTGPTPPAQSAVLVAPHGSVVLYINNELRRLYYVDPSTSIVLKAHPDTPFDQLVTMDPLSLEPKQVFFSGDPTTVFIDPGTPHEQTLRLEFNEPGAATFFLPGVGTPQRIQLGLPAAELVINNRPYQAAFGGPGVSVFLESDSKYHEFRLSDSRPVLKFSNDVRFDLWHKVVNESKVKAGINLTIGGGNFSQEFSQAPVSAASVPPFASQAPPSQYASFDSAPSQMAQPPPAPVATPSPFSDLNSLLSKLTAAGLITNPPPASAAPKQASENNNNHNNNRKQNKKQAKRARKENLPKQYLSLDVAALKTPHQFAIDQLYSGTQCTNCSLRFSDDALKEESSPGEKTKKSRYARHLDWHFRQNRREKAKPGSVASSTSTSVAHRRPWYYSLDLWTLYKEVNDDIEEDSAVFFDSNAVNSPSMLASGAFATFDFSQFKDSIPNFDAFVESINCDSASQENTKQCSVLAEADVGANTCAVCSEAFDLKWHEDDEEWRLMNAVRYNPDGDESAGKIYHPSCLKDLLIQKEKGTDDATAGNEMDVSASESISSALAEEEGKFSVNDSRNVLIPGLDCPIKSEDSEMNESEMDDSNQVNVETEIDQNEQMQTENPEEDESGENAEATQEEQIEVKVVEYEIPIMGTLKTESSELDEAPSEPVAAFDDSSNDSTGALSPKRTTVTGEGEQNSPSKSQGGTATTQPKRGGIVIKMKKSTTTTTSVSSPTATVALSESAESGNVLASSDSAVDKSESSGPESRPDHISTPFCDNKGNNVADITDDATTAINELAGEAESAGGLSSVEGTTSLSGQHEALGQDTEPLEHNPPPPQSDQDSEQAPEAGPKEEAQALAPSTNGGPEDGSGLTTTTLEPVACPPPTDQHLPTAEEDTQPPSSSDKPAQDNFFVRGQEISSLCTIM